MNKKIFSLFFIFLILILIFTNIYLTISHEEAHNQINKIFKCNSSYIEYSNFFLKGQTIANCSNLNFQQEIEVNKLHSFNEIFTYNLRVLINLSIILFIFLFFILFYLFERSTS
jgi:hypothetical protein